MLNGATTKLRNAQARMAIPRMNRARLQPLSRRGCAAARRVVREAIGPACFDPLRQGQARGGFCLSGHYVPAAMAAKQQHFDLQRLDALFAAEPDRLAR